MIEQNDDREYDEEGIILQHFYITAYSEELEVDLDVLNGYYRVEIHTAFREWIQQEAKEGRLFARENWQSLRDQERYIYMYVTYRYLFHWDDCFFHVRIDTTGCSKDRHVHTNNPTRQMLFANDRFEKIVPRFEITLYGWTDDENHPNEMITHWKRYPIMDLMEIPDQEGWKY